MVVNSAPASIRSARSALRWYARFADEALGANGTHFPPSPDWLAAWSLLFKRADTYSNYIGYLRFGCDIMGLDTSPVNHMLVKRAKAALKRRQAAPRIRKFIQARVHILHKH